MKKTLLTILSIVFAVSTVNIPSVSADITPTVGVELHNSMSGSIQPEQLNVAFLRFTISATDAPISVSEIKIGSDSQDANELRNARLFENYSDIPEIADIYTQIGFDVEQLIESENGIYNASFSNPTPIIIEAGTSKQFVVTGNLGQAREQIRIGVTNLTINVDYELQTQLPVWGNTFSIAPLVCTSFKYSRWGKCVDGFQTRTIISQLPESCVAQNAETIQSCVSQKVINKYSNKILLLSQNKSLWYVDRTGKKMQILTETDAQTVLSEITNPITEEDLNKIVIYGEKGNASFGNKRKRQFFQVQGSDEIWGVRINGRRVLITPENTMSFFTYIARRVYNNEFNKMELRQTNE